MHRLAPLPALLLLLAASPGFAQSAQNQSAQIQSDCRGQGSVGTAVMGQDGTITLNLHTANGDTVVAYKKGDPQYQRIYSHLGGIRPGEHKPVPAFC